MTDLVTLDFMESGAIGLPIYLQCLRAPVIWKLEITGKGDLSEWFVPQGNSSDKRDVLFDPWEKRLEFLKLKEGDYDSALAFLNSIGFFHGASPSTGTLLGQEHPEHDFDTGKYTAHIETKAGIHSISGLVLPLDVNSFWSTR